MTMSKPLSLSTVSTEESLCTATIGSVDGTTFVDKNRSGSEDRAERFVCGKRRLLEVVQQSHHV